MFVRRAAIVPLCLAVIVGWSKCNTLVDTQEKDCSEEIKILQNDLKETRKALTKLIQTLLNSREDDDDVEAGRDDLVRERRDLPDENDDILSQLPIGSLLGLRCKDGRDGRDGVGIPGKDGVGIPGKDGKDGRDGVGIPGKDGVGIPGKDGKDGKDGNYGERGIPGDKRAAGASGIPGKDGDDGTDGAPGTAGSSGVHGPPGEKGETGAPGMPGQKGVAGINGITGSPGTPGQRGQAGRSGTPGKDGVAGQPGMKGASGRSIENTGAIYTRWGRTSCKNQSTLIYSGFTAGADRAHSGGGVNYQCMPPRPEYNTYNSGGLHSFLAGAEYQSNPSGLFPNQIYNKNVSCARCYTNTRPAVMMLPAKRNCPIGWSREYEGYLMTEYHTHIHPATFECVDSNPEYISGSDSNTNGALFYFVKPICSGSGTILHCPPYINDRQLTCVVCSK